MNASTLFKLAAAALGVAVACTGRPAAGEGTVASATPPVRTPAPASTPASTPAPTAQPKSVRPSDFITVTGVACVDLDLNGLCAPTEAPVPNVAVRGVNGAVTATNQLGQFALLIPPRSELEITLPVGYRSVNGNLRQLRMQLLDADRVDIALARDDGTAIRASGGSVPVGTSDLRLVYAALVALGAILLIILGVLFSLRHAFLRSLAHQKLSLREQRAKDLAVRLQTEHGWQAIAEQLVADASRRNVAIDGDAGILEANCEPSPRFTIVTREGYEVVFTTGPRMLKKARLIRRGDRVVNVSALSPTSHIDADLLWRHVLGLRNMGNVSPPASANWYVVVRAPAVKPALGRRIAAIRSPAARRFAALRGGRT